MDTLIVGTKHLVLSNSKYRLVSNGCVTNADEEVERTR